MWSGHTRLFFVKNEKKVEENFLFTACKRTASGQERISQDFHLFCLSTQQQTPQQQVLFLEVLEEEWTLHLWFQKKIERIAKEKVSLGVNLWIRNTNRCCFSDNVRIILGRAHFCAFGLFQNIWSHTAGLILHRKQTGKNWTSAFKILHFCWVKRQTADRLVPRRDVAKNNSQLKALKEEQGLTKPFG